MQYYFILGIVLGAVIATTQSYYIGIAQHDITGPAAEINMVSYITCIVELVKHWKFNILW